VYREKGAHLLKACGAYDNVLMSRQPVKSVDDIKGKKVRDSGAYLDLVQNLGAAPVTLTQAELYMALQTGTVDAVCMPNYTIGTMKYWEVAKGIMLPALGPGSADIFVSVKAFESLPPDLREIVEEAAIEANYTYAAAVKERVGTLMDMAQKQYNVQIITVSESEFAKVRKAAEPVLQKMAGLSPKAAQLVAIIKEYLAAKK
jgi:TRAP-type C4-dicarboxylate transport system substrate-binding protein